MGPRAIVARALELGLGLIGLTDHNSARNTPALERLCREVGLGFVAGLEVTTREEAHCLCLFPDSATALDFGRLVESRQVRVPLKPELMGDQVVVDADEYVVEEVDHWLIAATDIEWAELGALVHAHGGLWVPAHVDRPNGGVVAQLGFLPPEDYDAVEVVDATWPGQTWDLRRLRHSDAHAPEHIGRRFWDLPDGEGPVWDRLRRYLQRDPSFP